MIWRRQCMITLIYLLMINKDRIIISASKPSMGALSYPHQNLTDDGLLTFLSLFFSSLDKLIKVSLTNDERQPFFLFF